MGSIYDYRLKSGARRWEVRYTRPDHKQGHKSGFKRKMDAQAYLDQVEVSKRTGEYIAPADARITLAVLAKDWLRAHKGSVKPSTYRPDESAWRIRVEPRWGSRTIGSIRTSEVQAWVSEMVGDWSSTTVLRAHGVLAAILDTAVADRRIRVNPARGVKLPKKVQRGYPYLSLDQVELLARESKYPDLVRFLAYTGLRWGEAAALRVGSIDISRRRLTVDRNAVPVPYKMIVGTPKGNRLRSVAYPEFLDGPIRRACEGKGRDDLLWGVGREYIRPGNSKNGWFANAVRRAQKKDPTMPRVTAHSLRHTAVSLAVSAGANVKAVQRMVGHESASTTLNTYADLFDTDLDGVAAALDTARSEHLEQ